MLTQNKNNSYKEHVLYDDGDKEAPNSIKNSHGEVVLALCKVCGGGESELIYPCVSNKEKGVAAQEIEKLMGILKEMKNNDHRLVAKQVYDKVIYLMSLEVEKMRS